MTDTPTLPDIRALQEMLATVDYLLAAFETGITQRDRKTTASLRDIRSTLSAFGPLIEAARAADAAYVEFSEHSAHDARLITALYARLDDLHRALSPDHTPEERGSRMNDLPSIKIAKALATAQGISDVENVSPRLLMTRYWRDVDAVILAIKEAGFEVVPSTWLTEAQQASLKG